MSTKATNIKSGVINLKPQGSTPANIKEGDFFVDSTTGLLKTNDGSSTDVLITTDVTQTLSNKEFDNVVISDPIGLTKANVGLSNVDNTSDLNKSISTDTQTALNNKQPLNSRLTQIATLTPSNDDLLQQDGGVMSSTSLATFKTELALTKTNIGLGNVDNTSDATQNSAIASLTNKTFVEPIIDNFFDLNIESEPATPSAGKIRLYAESDNKIYYKNSSGTEVELGDFPDSTTVSIPYFNDFSNITTRPFSQFNWESPQILANPGTLPTGNGKDCAWSPNGEFLAMAHATSLFIGVYQKQGTTLTKLANPSPLLPGQGNALDWSSNGEFLAAGHNTTPFISIYQRTNGTTFTKLTDPSILPPAEVRDCAWSPNGEFLACAHTTTPFVTIYQRSGTTFTKLTGAGGEFSSTLPTGTGFGVTWSPNGEFLAVAHNLLPFVSIYQRSGNTFTKLTDPSILPLASPNGCSFSPNGNFLAFVGTGGMTVYQKSGTTFTKITTPAFANTGQKCCWSLDSKLLAIAHFGSPYISIFERSGTTFTKLANPASLPTGDGYGCSFSSSGDILSIAHTTTPFITSYVTNNNMPSNGVLKLTRKEKSF